MSERAKEFLIQWFSAHVKALPAVQRLAESVRLATKCREDATHAGIPLHEVRAVAGGDLIRKLLEAMDIAARANESAVTSPELETTI